MVRRAVATVILVVLVCIVLLPLAWIALSSFKSRLVLLASPPVLLFTPTLENYATAISSHGLISNVVVSTVVALVSSLVAVGLGYPAASALAPMTRPVGRHVLFLILTTRLVPAVALGLPLFLTNLYPTDPERMKDFFMINTLGNPREAGYAAVSLMCGGVLDAFPNLEVFLPHAGGTFPWLIGRLDLGIKFSGELKHMKKPAYEYLRRFHYDLITHHPQIMRNLIDLVGVDRIVAGTDFPQGMSVKQPVDFVESIPGLTHREREIILSDNPARLLQISTSLDH